MPIKKQQLGLWMLIALVTGNMIGSGIFMLPADLARIGSISLLSWLFTSAGAILLGLVFSRMSLMVPKVGGPYAYASAGFGDFIGFQTSYNYWIALLVGNASLAVALIGYLRVFLPDISGPKTELAAELIVIWILTFINIKGIRSAGMTQLITMILKFIPLLLIAVFGWFHFHPEYITQSFNLTGKSNFSAFSYAATLTLWAFIGVESATIPSDSVRNPERNIPLATMLGVLIAAVIYISGSVAIMGMLPNNIIANSTSPFATAAEVILGNFGKYFIAAGAVISCFGALNGWTLLQGQVPMATAEDGLLPKIFAKRNKNNIPAFSLIFGTLVVSLLLIITSTFDLIARFQFLILIAAVTSLLAYFYTAFAEIILLPKEKRSSKSKVFNIIIAFLAGIYSCWAILGSGQEILMFMIIFIFSSVPLYAIIKYINNKKINYENTNQ